MQLFPNEYTARRVAEKDAKGCEVCFRPSALVLVASNSQDFFYCCPEHTRDRDFAKPLLAHPDHAPYAHLQEAVASLTVRVKALSRQVQDSKPPIWSSVWGSTSENKKSETLATGTDSDKMADSEADPKKPANDSEKMQPTHAQLKQQHAQLQAHLATQQSQLDAYEFKHFELNKSIHASRVHTRLVARKSRLQAQKMADPTFFPKAPSGAPL